ncbi:MAG: ATP-binding protein [Clostridia bacterium]|nr:ATP-binding protein [Clostridia bacterium]
MDNNPKIEAAEVLDNPFVQRIADLAKKTKEEDAIKGKGEHNFKPKDTDYQVDGLWYCGLCNAPMQANAPIVGIVSVDCLCEQEKKNAAKKVEVRQRADQKRKIAFGSENTNRFNFTFETDDNGDVVATRKAKYYCDNFKKYKKDGAGLLFHSETSSTGKTFLACAIANELIDQGYCVRVTDFATLYDEMRNFETVGAKSRIDYLLKLRAHDLLVVDDLGAENGHADMIAVQCRIINDLTENNVPLVLTTNYTLQEMAQCQDRDKRRIFERVLGSCVVVAVKTADGKSRRLEKCKRLTEEFNRISRDATR